MRKTIVTTVSLLMGSLAVLSQSYEVRPLSVNKHQSHNIAPFYKDSVLYFCSNRRNQIFVSYLNQNDEHLYRWYAAPLLPNGSYGAPRLFMPNLQTNLNNGPISFSADGKTLYATQSSQQKNKKQPAQMELRAYNLEGTPQRPEGQNIIQPVTEGSLGHPSVSPDGNTLFFSATIDQGFGNADIFMSERQNGLWSEPINLGRIINSPGNEVFPFIHTSGKLYFASDGHAGQGGLDIFYTSQKDGEWLTPIALPTPLNSPSDDYAVFLNKQSNAGYLTSNRDKSDYIYGFAQSLPQFETCEPQITDNYCFTLFEDGPYDSDTLPIAYRWDFGDGATANGKEADHCFPGPGSYHVTLNAVDTLLQIDLLTVADYQLDLERTEQVYISGPDTLKVGVAATFDAKKSYIVQFEPSEFYWDFGDGHTAKGIETTHVFNAQGTYVVKCGTVSDNDPSIKFCSSIEITVTE